jgi:hypothetical protein
VLVQWIEKVVCVPGTGCNETGVASKSDTCFFSVLFSGGRYKKSKFFHVGVLMKDIVKKYGDTPQ